MQPAVLVRLRPLGPWRNGSGQSSAAESVDSLFRSDRLYSALTLAFADLGFLDEWLNATARSEKPVVRLGSLFPYQGDTLFATPPNTLWPPPPGLITSPSPIFLSKLRWSQAQFVPMTLIQSLASGRPALAEQWIVDAESGCLLRRDRPSASPFRHTLRRRVAVDRLLGASSTADTFACIEFEPSAGLWTAITFADIEAETAWRERIEGAFRLLADSGFGGGRHIGWGQVAPPQFERGRWPNLLLPKLTGRPSGLHWLLSLYSPAPADRVDWSAGDYRLTTRKGQLTKTARLLDEGSVIAASADPIGRAVDVASESAAHPIYRSGFALTIQLPEPSATTPEEVTVVEEPVEAVPEPAAEPAGPELSDASLEQSE